MSPPPIPPPAGILSGFGISVITHSAVVNRLATPDASKIAVLTTLVGSIIPVMQKL